MDRRRFLVAAGAFASGGAHSAAALDSVVLPFGNGERPLVRYPGKRPLIQLTARPPQLETPFAVFDESVITPNDAFFVRYHLAGIPLSIDPETFRLEVKGKVDRPLSLSLADLKSGFDPVEIVAVNQCSGNSRGFFNPRVGGGQLGNGAMGNASWRGVPLSAILERAGLQTGARQIAFNGLDGPPLPETPDFIKALDLAHAGDGEVMVAYAMNGEDLPWLNGYPLRLVVPGYYGTYWVKHLSEIVALDRPFEGYWMTRAYRIPDNDCACTPPGRPAAATKPIERLATRSFVTNVTDGATLRAHTKTLLRGVAFGGGAGIAAVLVSADGGKNWAAAQLGSDLGRYSFREWRTEIVLPPGQHDIKTLAVSVAGRSQPLEPLWNPPGYMRNVVETLRVHAG